MQAKYRIFICNYGEEINYMRNQFKKVANDNIKAINEYLGDFTDDVWDFAHKSSSQIDQGIKLTTDKKTLDILLILRNSISDLLCCLDSLERGHDRTVDNNLRMAFEHYCIMLQIYEDKKAYARFLEGKLSASGAVSFAKKKKGFEAFGPIYSNYSIISHHEKYCLIARQIVSIKNNTELYMHLKPIDNNKIYPQISRLLFIALLLRFIGQAGERAAADILKELYFLEKHEGNLKPNPRIKENTLIDSLCLRVELEINSIKET